MVVSMDAAWQQSKEETSLKRRRCFEKNLQMGLLAPFCVVPKDGAAAGTQKRT